MSIFVLPVAEGQYDVEVNQARVVAGATPSEAIDALLRYLPPV
jgi:hypothetical protein